MKTMNYLITILLVFMIGSCSNETSIENEDLAAVDSRSRVDQEKEETQEVFALDLHQYYILGQIAKLEKRKRELEEEIEGGKEELTPTWESVVEQIQRNAEILGDILEKTCSQLKILERTWQLLASTGDSEAKKKLAEVRESMKGCPLSLPAYINLSMETKAIIAAIGRGDDVGEVCVPGIDLSTCQERIEAGVLLINYTETQGGGQEVYLKTVEGKVVNKGEMIGGHPFIEGVQQMAIELIPLENGMLEFKDNNGSFEKAVRVERTHR